MKEALKAFALWSILSIVAIGLAFVLVGLVHSLIAMLLALNANTRMIAILGIIGFAAGLSGATLALTKRID